ncbi:hypothetical protein BSLG_005376 [Batrachochytrium salamandrivorans]|nr:hypothetical protein BSLG_005376 [Batrachochytrium salamandrivorans]
MSVPKVTIFVVGPLKVGKTAISNHIAEMSESLNGIDYHPTQGVRILEFYRKLVSDGNTHKWKEVTLEGMALDFICLRDITSHLGSYLGYHTCWPAVSTHIHGVLFITSPDLKQDKELDVWAELFPTIKSNQCAVFVHRPINSLSKTKVKMTHKTLARAPLVYTSLDQEPETIRSEFDALLASAYSAMLDSREKEEKLIAG